MEEKNLEEINLFKKKTKIMNLAHTFKGTLSHQKEFPPSTCNSFPLLIKSHPLSFATRQKYHYPTLIKKHTLKYYS